MVRAKNYETVSKFVKVMPRILWPIFPRHGVLPVVTFDTRSLIYFLCRYRCMQK